MCTLTRSHLLEPVHRKTIHPLEQTSLPTYAPLDVLPIRQELVGEMTIKHDARVSEHADERDARRELVDEVDVVWAGERAQNVVVAEGLRLRTGGSRTGIVAGLDLVTTATRTRPRVVRGFNSGLRN